MKKIRKTDAKAADLTVYYDEKNPSEFVVYDLKYGDSIIGRNSTKCQVALRFTSDLDDVHTKITIEDSEYTIEDQGSQKGTFKIKSDNSLIRLKPFKSYDLAPQTAFYIGKFKCVFRVAKSGKNDGLFFLSPPDINSQLGKKNALKQNESLEDVIEEEKPSKIKIGQMAKNVKNSLQPNQIEEEEKENIKVTATKKSNKQGESEQKTEILSQKKFVKAKGQLPKQAIEENEKIEIVTTKKENETEKSASSSQLLKNIEERLQSNPVKQQKEFIEEIGNKYNSQKKLNPKDVTEEKEEAQISKKQKSESKPKLDAKGKQQDKQLSEKKQNKEKSIENNDSLHEGLDHEAKAEEKRLENMDKILESIKEAAKKQGKKSDNKVEASVIVEEKVNAKKESTSKRGRKKEQVVEEKSEKKNSNQENESSKNKQKSTNKKEVEQTPDKKLLVKRKANQVTKDEEEEVEEIQEKKISKKKKLEQSEEIEIPKKSEKKKLKQQEAEKEVTPSKKKVDKLSEKEKEKDKSIQETKKPTSSNKKIAKSPLIKKTKKSKKEVEQLKATSLPNSIGIPRRKQFRALFSNSSITDEQKKQLSKLGISVLEDFEKPNEFNLLVTDSIKRRVKLLVAINQGIPIVSSDWATYCILENQALPFDPFIINKADKQIQKQYSFDLADSIKSQTQNQEGVLHGIIICQTHPLDNISNGDITKLVKSAGGQSFNFYSKDCKVYYLSEPQKVEENKKLLEEGYKVVDIEGLLQSCLTQKNILEDYLIGIKKKVSKK